MTDKEFESILRLVKSGRQENFDIAINSAIALGADAEFMDLLNIKIQQVKDIEEEKRMWKGDGNSAPIFEGFSNLLK